MNIETFRSDFLEMKEKTGATQNRLSEMYGVEQGSLSRFISGRQGLSFNNVVALWPFVYGENFPGVAKSRPRKKRPTATPTTAQKAAGGDAAETLTAQP